MHSQLAGNVCFQLGPFQTDLQIHSKSHLLLHIKGRLWEAREWERKKKTPKPFTLQLGVSSPSPSKQEPAGLPRPRGYPGPCACPRSGPLSGLQCHKQALPTHCHVHMYEFSVVPCRMLLFLSFTFGSSKDPNFFLFVSQPALSGPLGPFPSLAFIFFLSPLSKAFFHLSQCPSSSLLIPPASSEKRSLPISMTTVAPVSCSSIPISQQLSLADSPVLRELAPAGMCGCAGHPRSDVSD